MAFYILHGLDGPNGAEIRKTTRQAHLDWLQTLGPRYRAGSPLLDEAGTMLGSVVVIEADDLAHAQATFALDPYAKAKLWDRVSVLKLGAWAPK